MSNTSIALSTTAVADASVPIVTGSSLNRKVLFLIGIMI